MDEQERQLKLQAGKEAVSLKAYELRSDTVYKRPCNTCSVLPWGVQYVCVLYFLY